MGVARARHESSATCISIILNIESKSLAHGVSFSSVIKAKEFSWCHPVSANQAWSQLQNIRTRRAVKEFTCSGTLILHSDSESGELLEATCGYLYKSTVCWSGGLLRQR